MSYRWLGALLSGLSLVACTTVDPGGVFERTKDGLAGRHPGELAWRRNGLDAGVESRLAELLAVPLSPDAAAEVALLANPRVQATLTELGLAQADLAQANRLANPSISWVGLAGGGERKRTYEVKAELVDWLLVPLRRKVAEAELERVRLEVSQALLTVVADARLSLLRYQAARAIAKRLASVEEIDRAAADYARALFDAGNLTALERANAEAGWAETRAELARARNEVERSREEVLRALGLSGQVAWEAERDLAPPGDETFDLAALEVAALARRFDVAAARWAVDAVGRALALKKKTRWLPVGVEVGVEREREPDGVTLSGPFVELRLPLFDTGKASIARLEAELARTRWQLAALEGQVGSEVRVAAAALVAAKELHSLYRETVLPLRLEVLDRTLREYNQMVIGTFDVLQAKEAEIEAEQASIAAQLAYWEARVELELALGGALPAAQNPSATEEPKP